MAYLLLSIAIACEVVATLCLRASGGLSKLLPVIAGVIAIELGGSGH
jgi:multidrug transporter EmrE-like cation transporter